MALDPHQHPHQPYLNGLHELVTMVNGFVYQGDRLEAIVKTIRVLREQPDLAARLLDPEVDAGDY